MRLTSKVRCTCAVALLLWLPEKNGPMETKNNITKQRSPDSGRRMIASLKEAVAWAEGRDVAVGVTTVEMLRRSRNAQKPGTGPSFAGKFGFQPATLKNWEQGRTRPDGPAPRRGRVASISRGKTD
jgi:hypothetical protein